MAPRVQSGVVTGDGWVARQVGDLFPGYFAVTMATGVIAVACHQQDLDGLADSFLLVAVASYVVVGALTALRVVRYPRRVLDDLTSADKGFAFLTAVVGLSVLGTGATVIRGNGGLGWATWWLALVAWVAVLTAVLVGLTVRRTPTDGQLGFNGTWFLIVVSTQSVVVLGGVQLHRHPSDVLALLVLGAFVMGLSIFPALFALLLHRLVFHPVDAMQLQPTLWIVPGSLFISTLGGATLIAARADNELLDRAGPFVETATVGAFTMGSLLIPVLVALGVWRHVVGGVRVAYHPGYWSIVFPLGMYSASSQRMIDVTGIEGLDRLPDAALGVALVAWVLCALGLIAAAGRRGNDLRAE